MTPFPPRRRWLPALLVAAILVATLIWLDSRTVERGNRLFHGGRISEAEQQYRLLASEEVEASSASYNLGTTLLSSDLEEARRYLRLAAESPDSATAHHGSYNLGYGLLTQVDGSVEPDVAIELLTAAVSTNRTALRLDPRDEDARWNLALGQRMLDSLTVAMGTSDDEESEEEEKEGNESSMDDVALADSGSGDDVSAGPDDPPPADGAGDRRIAALGSGDTQASQDAGPVSEQAARDLLNPVASALRGAAQGAREAWASQDPGTLSEEEARGLLDPIPDDPERLIRGILWSHRPDVAWWEMQGYPGGSW